MNPQELLERLQTLAACAISTQTVLIAPNNMAQARDWVDQLNTREPSNPAEFEGQVTAQDLRDFLRSIEYRLDI